MRFPQIVAVNEIPSECQRGRAHFYTWPTAMYACALRGDGPDTRVPGPFASLRSEQGACRPLRRYAAIPRLGAELNIV